jgi:putative transposase
MIMPLDRKSNPAESSLDELAPGPRAGGPGSVREWAEALVTRPRGEGVALTRDEGLLTSMVREVSQDGLDVEMADDLGYEPYEACEPWGRGTGNSRNGGYPKTVSTNVGPAGLRMPRDHQGTFEPVTIPKHVGRLEGLGAKVISLYARD